MRTLLPISIAALSILCSCAIRHDANPGRRSADQTRLRDYVLWRCDIDSANVLADELGAQSGETALTLERYDLAGNAEVDRWPVRFQRDMTLATRCVWKKVSVSRPRVALPGGGEEDVIFKNLLSLRAPDGGEAACIPLAISDDRNLLLASLAQEAAGRNCYYPQTYAVVRIPDGGVLAQRRVCAAMPLEQCSGFVRADPVLAYVLGEAMQTPEAYYCPVLALTSSGDCRTIEGITAHGISGSPDGREIALVCAHDGTAVIELRSADLTRQLWRREWRISPSMDEYDSCNSLVWSTDGRLVCLYVGREPSGPDTFLALDSRNGSIVESYNRTTKNGESWSPVFLVRKGTSFDPEAAFGVVRKRAGKRRHH